MESHAFLFIVELKSSSALINELIAETDFKYFSFFSWNLFLNAKFLIFSASSHPDFLGNEQFHILTLHSVSHMDTNPHDRSPDDTQPVKLLINYLFLSWGVTRGGILAENKFRILDDLFWINFGRASILAKFWIICINFV